MNGMQNMFPTRSPLKQVRTAAILLLTASVLLLAGFVLHPEETPDAAEQVAIIGANADAWALSHWVLFAGGIALAAGCFLLAKARYGPTRFTSGRVAFIALGVSAVLALEIFVLEATLSVSAGRTGDVEAYEALLLPEIPGILGLLGLGVSGAAVFMTQARDDCPVLPSWANWIGSAAAVLGVVGSVAFILGNTTLAILQYGTAAFIVVLLAFGIKAIRDSRPRGSGTPAASAKPKMG